MQLPRERGPISRHVIRRLTTADELTTGPAPDLADGAGSSRTTTPSWPSGSSTSSTTAVSTACPADMEWTPAWSRAPKAGGAVRAGAARGGRAGAEGCGTTRTASTSGHRSSPSSRPTTARPSRRFLQREASLEQVLELLREKSLQQLKESDPQAFVLPRLEGARQGRPGRAPLRRVRRGPAHAPPPGALRRCARRPQASTPPTAPTSTTSRRSDARQRQRGVAVRAQPAAARGGDGSLRHVRGDQLGPFTQDRCRDRAARAPGCRGGVLPRARRGRRRPRADRRAATSAAAWSSEQPSLRADVLFGAAGCLHLEGLLRTRAAPPLDGRMDAAS